MSGEASGLAEDSPDTRWPVAVLVVGVVAGGAVALWQARRTWFFSDEWTFLLNEHLSARELFTPHNEHWSTLPQLDYRVMVGVFGINHHLFYAALPVLLHVGICLVLYAVLRRHGVSPWPALVPPVLLAFLCGNLAENLVWAFQIGFLGSAFFGLLTLLLADAAGSRRWSLWPAWVAAALSLMSSGMALPMIGFAALVILLNHGVRRAVLLAVPPAVLYLAWYAAFGRGASPQEQHGASARQLGDFVHVGLSSLWQQVVRAPGWGGVILVGLALLAWLVPADPRARRLALGGVVACVATYCLLSYSRAALGTAFALSSRYSYFGVLMTLPAFAVVVDATWSWLRGRFALALVRGAVLAVVLVALAVSGTRQTIAYTDARLTLAPDLHQQVLGAMAIIRSGQPTLNQAVEPSFDPDITVEALRGAEESGRAPAGRPTAYGLLLAAHTLQVGVGPQPFGVGTTAGVRLVRVRGTVPTTGCSELAAGNNARIELSSDTELSIATHHAKLKTELAEGRLRSQVLSHPTTPGQPTYVANASAGTLDVLVRPGELTVCAP